MTGFADRGAAPDSTVTYAFAVCRGEDASGAPLPPGLSAGAPVRALRFGALTAIVQEVPAADFTEEVWRRRLSDRAEVERCARAHHAVVTAVARFRPTVPLALCTLYRDDWRAIEALGRDEARFAEVLDRVAGHVEWGVKVYVRPEEHASGPDGATGATPRPAPGAAARGSAGGPAPGAGRAYLAERRERQRSRVRRHEETLRDADVVDTTLRGLASAARRLQPQHQELTGDPRPQILNAAYLVAQERTAELSAAVTALRRRVGAHIEVTGPWVPYSFAGEV
ncbi:GvpL/GvpF family gas vesicle protein [Streptomyces sp. PTM05]|uniref:GvpL/GvpF family gas vesicle protein n=1 Tax=Streptantibioticus parmotrematis TaxID=2873249 RepID=A0ABS7R0L1_9ACTN|nr:GvpL/GvpF family gas vesicle protein [Streptantibioticus parmotrematis]MBY8888996.1 GvpL/GvpF family gas vesicle protein [Streptantibioticus parmotrematis]